MVHLINNIVKMMNDSTVKEEQVQAVHENVQTPASTTDSTAPKENGQENKDTVTSSSESNKEIPQPDVFDLSYVDKDFVLECMSVPSNSYNEQRLVTFVMLWAVKNKVKYEFDDFGNLYLTKGTLNEGEYYPCVTSHLDSVQRKQDPYIFAGVNMDLKIEVDKDGAHKVSVQPLDKSTVGIGIGADDKGGICICLSMFQHFDKLKACFFLQEEVGCLGSKKLDKEWFNDVGYVIGYDSPDLYRAAWSCSGTKLFSYEFYEKYMKEVCDEWGYKDCFYSEPFTDVKEIREQVGVICMNFGNGGYLAHNQTDEFCVIEDMDIACGLGVALINKIGCTRHYLENTSTYDTVYWKKGKDGIYEKDESLNDIPKLESLGDNKRHKSYNSYSSSSSYSSSTTPSTSVKKEDEIKFETVEYIVNRYETYIENIKTDILAELKAAVESQTTDLKALEEAISKKFNKEITF